MVEPEVVRQMRLRHEAGWGANRITDEDGVARTQRREQRAAEVVTFRYETEPGGQMQFAFGERRTSHSGATGMFSRARAALPRAHQGQDREWREVRQTQRPRRSHVRIVQRARDPPR